MNQAQPGIVSKTPLGTQHPFPVSLYVFLLCQRQLSAAANAHALNLSTLLPTTSAAKPSAVTLGGV